MNEGITLSMRKQNTKLWFHQLTFKKSVNHTGINKIPSIWNFKNFFGNFSEQLVKSAAYVDKVLDLKHWKWQLHSSKILRLSFANISCDIRQVCLCNGEKTNPVELNIHPPDSPPKKCSSPNLPEWSAIMKVVDRELPTYPLLSQH